MFESIKVHEGRNKPKDLEKQLETDTALLKHTYKMTLIQLDDIYLKRQKLFLGIDPEAGLETNEDRWSRKSIRIITNLLEGTGGHHFMRVSDSVYFIV